MGSWTPDQPGDDAHLAKEVDDDKAVGDGRDQHGQDGQEPEQGTPHLVASA